MNYSAARGTKDILPGDIHVWQHIEQTCRSLFEVYNFNEIRTPIFESTDLFLKGIGDATDIVQKEMYTFTDKGDRSLTLRPEGTAPIVRAVIEHSLCHNMPQQKLYYMGPMFRYERPQAGRYRQFHQIGVEHFGHNDPLSDAEMITMIYQVFQQLEIKDLSITVNTIGCQTSRTLIEEKIRQIIEPHIGNFSIDVQEKCQKNPLRLLDSKDPKIQTYLSGMPNLSEIVSQASQDHFHQVLDYLDKTGIPYKIDPKLVRGLDYYSETVFEVVSDNLGAQNAICAGGRYNQLTESLGGQSIPAIGCAFGVERIVSLLENNNSIPKQRTTLYIIPLGQNQRRTCFDLTFQARSSNIKTELGLSDNLKSELKKANKLNADYVLIYGEEEAENKLGLLKNMTDRTQVSMPLDQILSSIQNIEKTKR